MRLQIRLNGIHLAALLALPLPFAVLAVVVFLYPGNVAKCAKRIVMNASGLGANVYRLEIIMVAFLEFPWDVVAPLMQLELLLCLEQSEAQLTDVTGFC